MVCSHVRALDRASDLFSRHRAVLSQSDADNSTEQFHVELGCLGSGLGAGTQTLRLEDLDRRPSFGISVCCHVGFGAGAPKTIDLGTNLRVSCSAFDASTRDPCGRSLFQKAASHPSGQD